MSSQPVNPFAQPRVNPFAQNQPNGQVAAPNPFGAKPPATNPFLAKPSTSQERSSSPAFGQPQNAPSNPFNPFSKPENAGEPKSATADNKPPPPNPFSKPPSTFANGSTAPAAPPTTNGIRKVAEFVQPAWPKRQNVEGPVVADSAVSRGQTNGKRKSEFDMQGKAKFSRNSPDPNVASIRSSSPLPGSGRGNKQNASRGGRRLSPHTSKARGDDFAEKIQRQLSKDNIKPPKWPANPGSRAQRPAIEALREAHRVYREKARKSLIRAGLIDDPDKKRTLDKALVFRGICEDMCPEWERITRIVEHDVRAPEKETDENGEQVAMPPSMIKRLARSAAGQDAPLPMDVRSFTALRQTLDYLIDELIPSDDLLPSRHSFLWDRTRAIRIDFTFQLYDMTPEDRVDQIYCLETIARFHVTSLHLLSQEGFAPEDFSEQQEIEQLGKTLISLIEAYDDGAQQGVECENEIEFRGYYILFNAHNPSLMEIVQGWGPRFWDADGIRTAMCLVQSMENTWRLQGPLNPSAPTEIAIDAASMFFSIVAAPQISYTMGCFAEIHFNSIRKSILQVIKGAYSRPRDGPKDLTPAFLKQRLHLDTEQEAIDFVRKHGFQFAEEGDHQYLILNSNQKYTEARIRHPFSRDIVERKRSGKSLPQVIHETVYEQVQGEKPILTPEDSLFVNDSRNGSITSSSDTAAGSDVESRHPLPTSSPPVTSSPVTSTPGSSVADSQTTSFPMKQSSTSFSTEPDKSMRVQPTSSGPSTTTTTLETKPFGSFPAVSTSWPPTPQPQESKQAENQKAAEISDTQGAIPHTKKKVSFADMPIASTSPPKPSVAGSSVFGSLGDKKESKDSIPPPKAPSPSPFSGLLSRTSGPPDNDGSQTSVLAGTSTPPISGFTFPSLPTPTSQPTASPIPHPRAPSSPGSAQPADVSSTKQSTPFNGKPILIIFIHISRVYYRAHDIHIYRLSTIKYSTYQPQLTKPALSFASSTPGVQVTTPATSENSFAKQPFAATGTSLSSPQASSTSPKLSQQIVRKDPMEGFTRWFVCGDRGLMESRLEEFAVDNVVKEIWENFQAIEQERRRKEEDEKSWAEARKFRTYSLSVTYFYRWLNGFRKRRVVKRIQMEKEKARQWRLPENVAKRELAVKAAKEKAIQEAQELVRRRARRNVEQAAQLRESTRSRQESREQSIEDALLASGVLRGVRDERAAARLAARDNDIEVESEMLPSEKILLRSENQRRRKHGLNQLNRLPEPKTYPEGSKTAKLKALCSGAGRDSTSMSTSSLRNSTFSSSYRSSLGLNSSRVSKPKSRVSDPYWRLKASGLVQMPNGEYLHESLALPMLREGKRFPGLGNYGLSPVNSATPSQSPPPPTDYSPPIPIDGIGRTRYRRRTSRVSSSPSVAEGSAQKRKRTPAEDEDLAAYRNEAPSGRKRARSGGDSDNRSSVSGPDLLASIANLMKDVEDLRKSTKKIS
ncbi:SAC3/GANP/Nin1/mts3/eIF-3 p25 family-domain-containing protein [Xylariaceae sp. FL0662B]|nr:SAC3/GANP/Nin1/mts3/eIF-3 p25 family-domain-containing protein [Xylariaceae sp. FL0662B]